jgi:hypothetical protein
LLELTIFILGIILLTKLVLPQILELIDTIIPQIQKIVVKLRQLLLEIKNTLAEFRTNKK